MMWLRGMVGRREMTLFMPHMGRGGGGLLPIHPPGPSLPREERFFVGGGETLHTPSPNLVTSQNRPATSPHKGVPAGKTLM